MQFIMNDVQNYVDQRLDQQREETGRVRALILKGRQQGISTYISARYYHRTTMNRGLNVFILTHEDSATENLFNMAKRYNDNNPIAPSTKSDSAKSLTFAALDSGYSVGTAGNKSVGRSKTVMLFHGSEVAFWPNAASHFAGIIQAVPDIEGTEIILESTANGVGGQFHERWQQAERGEGDYIAVFVPWFWSKEYARPVPSDFSLNDEESAYLEMHAPNGLTMENMVWRRAKVSELGDQLFKQEYPATAQEAFQMTGHDGFIKPDIIMRARQNTVEPFGPLVIGVDPSRFGDDAFAVAYRRGRKVIKVDARHKLSNVDGANWIRSLIDEDGPSAVFVDVGGVGGGVYDILQSWGPPYSNLTKAVNFGSPPHNPSASRKHGGPANRRAEMWANSREWLQDVAGVDIPDLDVLQSDACSPGYKYNLNQQVLIESKEDMRKRGVKSPDYWDAVALTFAEPVKERILEKPKSDRYNRFSNNGASSPWSM